MIYIHVPFCRSFCTYCDFYSEVACKGRDADDFRNYLSSLKSEISSRVEEFRLSNSLKTLYIGGGTPSVLPLSFFEEILALLPERPDGEFTVEVNPDDITPEYAVGLGRLGVNRISMGVQSFDDSTLKWMNRRHNATEAENAFGILRRAGFDNISIDLIYGTSTDKGLENTIRKAVALGPEHISAYQLTIEEGSTLDRLAKEGRYQECTDEECRAAYDLVCRLLGDAGYEHYEISSWAKPGKRSVHNSAYWNRTPYIGLGPGAHSFIIYPDGRQVRSWNSCDKSNWTRGQETLLPQEIREETIMLGLRTAEGIVLDGKKVKIPEKDWFVADSIIGGLV